MRRVLTVVAWVCLVGLSSAFPAAPPVGLPSVFPSAIAVSVPTDVRISVRIPDPRVIPTSVTLQRLDDTGVVVAVVGALNDNGTLGDVIAGDQIFSLQKTFSESTVGQVRLRISAALRGVLQRVTSPVFVLEVSAPGVPNSPRLFDPSKVIADPQTGQQIVLGQAVLVLRDGASLADLQTLLARYAASLIGRIPDLGVFQVEFPWVTTTEQLKVVVAQLSAESVVRAVQVVPVIHSLRVPNDPKIGQQWAMGRISATAAWDITTGGSVGIGIVDTGVKANHEDLQGKVIPGFDFADLDFDPNDTDGHGTLVAGVAGAATNNGIGIAGMCWTCSLISERIHRSGTGSPRVRRRCPRPPCSGAGWFCRRRSRRRSPCACGAPQAARAGARRSGTHRRCGRGGGDPWGE